MKAILAIPVMLVMFVICVIAAAIDSVVSLFRRR